MTDTNSCSIGRDAIRAFVSIRPSRSSYHWNLAYSKPNTIRSIRGGFFFPKTPLKGFSAYYDIISFRGDVVAAGNIIFEGPTAKMLKFYLLYKEVDFKELTTQIDKFTLRDASDNPSLYSHYTLPCPYLKMREYDRK